MANTTATMNHLNTCTEILEEVEMHLHEIESTLFLLADNAAGGGATPAEYGRAFSLLKYIASDLRGSLDEGISCALCAKSDLR